jgi:hypothetical protein
VAVKCGVDMLGGMLYVLLRAPPPAVAMRGRWVFSSTKGPSLCRLTVVL